MGLTKTDGAPLAYAWLGGMGTRESQLWFTSLSIPNWIPQEGMRNSLNELLITYLLLLLRRFSRVRLCATPETAAHQAPQTLGFSRQEHWSGLPFPSPVHESEK